MTMQRGENLQWHRVCLPADQLYIMTVKQFCCVPISCRHGDGTRFVVCIHFHTVQAVYALLHVVHKFDYCSSVGGFNGCCLREWEKNTNQVFALLNDYCLLNMNGCGALLNERCGRHVATIFDELKPKCKAEEKFY